MTQRIAIILSAVLTAFLLVVGGGVVARISSNPQPAEAGPVALTPTGTPAPASTATPDINAQVEALLQEREAQYRALIKQANERLETAYQQQAATQSAASPTAVAAPSVASVAAAAQPAVPTVAVSADTAAATAASVAYNNQPMVRAPELVLFASHVAYEVVFKHGSIYVDANNGQVLFNGTTNRPGNQTVSVASATNHDDDHDDDHGDDHD